VQTSAASSTTLKSLVPAEIIKTKLSPFLGFLGEGELIVAVFASSLILTFG